METRVVTRVTIKATPKAVYTYFEDTRKHYVWNPHLQRVIPEGRLKVGDFYSAESVVLGIRTVAKNQVVKLVRGKEFEVKNDTGLLHYCVNYTLVPKNISTIVICTTVVSADGKAFAFAKPVLQKMARHELQSDLKALKRAVEEGMTNE